MNLEMFFDFLGLFDPPKVEILVLYASIVLLIVFMNSGSLLSTKQLTLIALFLIDSLLFSIVSYESFSVGDL